MTYGDPEKPLYWSSKSQRKLSAALKEFGVFASHPTIGKLLDKLGYSRKRNRKLEQVGEKHKDSDAQMQNIANKNEQYKNSEIVIISVDFKKKENLGNYRNSGDDYCQDPINVNEHDFKGDNTITAVPYGIYDVELNEGFVNLGISSDTPEFAVASIKKWWEVIGHLHHPNAKALYITSDSGGSNSYKSIRFKLKLQEFANESGLTIIWGRN